MFLYSGEIKVDTYSDYIPILSGAPSYLPTEHELTCSITGLSLEEPYSSELCKNTFERSAILDKFETTAVLYDQSSGGKKLKCPVESCNKIMGSLDFFDNRKVERKVMRSKATDALSAMTYIEIWKVADFLGIRSCRTLSCVTSAESFIPRTTRNPDKTTYCH